MKDDAHRLQMAAARGSRSGFLFGALVTYIALDLVAFFWGTSCS